MSWIAKAETLLDKNQTQITKKFLVIFGDIHKDDLQSIFPYAIMDITKFNEKIFVKQRKKLFREYFNKSNFLVGRL